MKNTALALDRAEYDRGSGNRQNAHAGSPETGFQRIRMLRDRVMSRPYETDIERAKYYTRAYKRTEGQPACMRAALGLEETLRNMTIRIEEGECIVGSKTAKKWGGPMYIEAYFALGGRHIQINPVSQSMLKDAQAHPENYPELSVKVSGFSMRFIDIHKALQDDIIARKEFSM